ncbi:MULTISPECIES: creatininase family protein [unclassified Chelatococcus]|uniref:creatininase family protein n=1 Tax=unclassified Chelatococcus TaxID=2638111 RepID=UPI0003042629|nr:MULTISPECIES: creatininase family protein [unclassified Chelatococcus]ALA16688.1 creatininase [Chelatococcus sp. CO-6]
MFPSRYWIDLTSDDFRRLPMGEAIAVLPVAAVEQHGPHLPVGVDTHIMQGYLDAVARRLPDDLPVLFLPVQAVGKSNEHLAYPGTLTLSAETAMRAWTDIGQSIARAGCRKLVIVNSHGGNVAIIDIVGRELRVAHAMLVVSASWHRFGYPDLFAARELRHGIHAGEVETSLMLAFRPDTVRMDKAENFEPRSLAMEQRYRHIGIGTATSFGWMSQDLHEAGAMGDAASASREKGEACAIHGAEAFIAMLREVADCPPPQPWRDGKTGLA